MEPTTVEAFSNLLAKSKLLPADEVKTALARWREQAGSGAGDLQRFANWLVAEGHITDYQAGLLKKGLAGRFFIHDYRLLDRIGVGRMAGVYKAVHLLGQTVAIKILPPSKVKDEK